LLDKHLANMTVKINYDFDGLSHISHIRIYHIKNVVDVSNIIFRSRFFVYNQFSAANFYGASNTGTNKRKFNLYHWKQ